MSLNNPAQPPIENVPSRPRTPLRPADRYTWAHEDQPIDEAHQAEPVTSRSYNGAADDGVQTATRDSHEGEREHRQTPFQPFFTLIEDAHTGDYHHPTVHYIFSDDDTDIVTEAALRSLEAQQDALAKGKKPSSLVAQEHAKDPAESTLLPPPIPGVHENYIVLDIEPLPANTKAHPATGHIAHSVDNQSTNQTKRVATGMHLNSALSPSATQATQSPTQAQASPGAGVPQTQFHVTSAKSFSPNWQILSSELAPAPTFENHDPGTSPGHGLMLNIHGISGLPVDAGKDRVERGTTRLEDMMDQFAKRMRELQMIIDAAGMEGPAKEEGGQGTQENVMTKVTEGLQGGDEAVVCKDGSNGEKDD